MLLRIVALLGPGFRGLLNRAAWAFLVVVLAIAVATPPGSWGIAYGDDLSGQSGGAQPVPPACCQPPPPVPPACCQPPPPVPPPPIRYAPPPGACCQPPPPCCAPQPQMQPQVFTPTPAPVVITPTATPSPTPVRPT